MKPIKINDLHKLKLEEMCKSLFPDYDFTLDRFRQCTVTFGLKSEKLYQHHTPWFEFCATHLVDAIFYPKGKSCRGSRSKVEQFLFNSFMYGTEEDDADYVHPVDYLHEEFLKLKR